jgi:hypothetical protein
VLKVCQDADNLVFYAETAETISSHTNTHWMWLLLDVRGKALPDWEGFNFLINRQVSNESTTSIEACTGGWAWQPIGQVVYRVEGNRMHLKIPKALLGIQGETFTVEFKWIDNAQRPGDILDVYTHGDAAPEGRFRYRYDAQQRTEP